MLIETHLFCYHLHQFIRIDKDFIDVNEKDDSNLMFSTSCAGSNAG